MVKKFILVALSTIFAVFLIETILPIFFEEYKTTPKVKYYNIENGARIGKKIAKRRNTILLANFMLN